MNQNSHHDVPHEISLGELLCRFWRARSFMMVGGFCGLIIAALFIFFVQPEFKSTMIVAPADGYALGDYASSVQYDSMATLPFWRPKDQEGASTDFYRFIYTLRGVAAATVLLKDGAVLAGINKGRRQKITSAEELSDYLNRQIRIDPLGATPLRRISYYHADPDFAAALLRKLHLVADQMIRRDRRRQSQSRIDYLENALKKTTHPDHRKGITNLLMQQEHIQMLANLDEDYAAIIVEPASSESKASMPNKPFVFSVALFVGLLSGYLLYALRTSREKQID